MLANLKSGGELNEKYPGGSPSSNNVWKPRDIQSSKRKRFVVADFEKALFKRD
jgi:hypothetical protein